MSEDLQKNEKEVNKADEFIMTGTADNTADSSENGAAAGQDAYKTIDDSEPFVEPDIQDLYFEYADRMEGIENNRYFKYLFDMVKAGDNKFFQSNQILHKVVDESWLQAIEDSLEALNRIVNKPRKYITSVEEVVPVGLAKRISADSVKHLSKHSEFIVSEAGEPVQPTKILNVSIEETYDLYENRFIFHLIQRLIRFIDKRTDVIFWATGDEKRNKLVFESRIDDAFEQIEYKVEMTIKNLKSFAENDSDNMEVFARIDRVRRLVMSIKSSSFCQIMQGCAIVRSPIQRTNIMIKDRDYRVAYRLWQFLENYDDVGYNIEVIDNTMAFDEEYVNKMFTNLVSEYTTFKSIMEEDERELSEELRRTQELARSERDIRPKFIPIVQEVEVDSRDIPEVEIRKVFVEEVTEAQIAAERKAEEALKAMEEARAAQAEAEHRMIMAQHETEEANSRAAETERRLEKSDEKIAELEKKITDTEEARQKTIEEADKEIERIKEVSAGQIEQVRRECEENLDREIALLEARMSAAAAAAAADAQKRIEEAEQRAANAEHDAETTIAQIRNDTAETIANIRTESEAAVTKAQAEAEAAVNKAQTEADEAVTRARMEADEAVAKARTEADEAVTKARTEADEAVAKARTEADEAVTKAQTEAEAAVTKARTEADEAVAKAQTEADAAIARNMAETSAIIAANNEATASAMETAQAEADRINTEASERLEIAQAALREARDKEAFAKQTRIDTDKELKAQRQEVRAANAQREQLSRKADGLEKRIEDITRSREADEKSFQKRIRNIQADLAKTKSALDAEKKLRKENARALRKAENELDTALRRAESYKTQYERLAARENEDTDGVVKKSAFERWLKR